MRNTGNDTLSVAVGMTLSVAVMAIILVRGNVENPPMKAPRSLRCPTSVLWDTTSFGR